ncbi:MAG: 3',5'-cyclic-nucleotide phosphodiesterase [Gammaproteobacteria bacterium]|nr:3',5'-cyclic-nucleotide phosphodiesterase [Gammaproteobacteria bacterium]
MKIRVLGSSGGIAQGYRTTSFLVDDDILIDAGTGAQELSIDEMASIRHIFLTHSHFDHIASLPLLADTVFDKVPSPIEIYALSDTIGALMQHVFNDVLWPDFTALPNQHNPVIRFNPMQAGSVLSLGGRSIEMISVNHIVPGVGYRVSAADKAFAFSGDTCTNDGFWQALNRHEHLDLLFVESAFPNANRDLSIRSGHYCPSTLAEDLKKLNHRPLVCISHPKPGEEGGIWQECREAINGHEIQGLLGGEQFTL